MDCSVGTGAALVAEDVPRLHRASHRAGPARQEKDCQQTVVSDRALMFRATFRLPRHATADSSRHGFRDVRFRSTQQHHLEIDGGSGPSSADPHGSR
jgi:hypothetical protein